MSHVANPTYYSPDDKFQVTGKDCNRVEVWNLETAEIESQFSVECDYIDYIVFSNDGNLLATASIDGQLLVWDWRKGQQLNSFRGPLKVVYALLFSADDKYLKAYYVLDEESVWHRASDKPLTPNEVSALSPALFDTDKILEKMCEVNPFHIPSLVWSSPKALCCINLKYEGCLMDRRTLNLLNYFSQNFY